MRQCSNCELWIREEDYEVGACCRYPKRYRTEATHWCAEIRETVTAETYTAGQPGVIVKVEEPRPSETETAPGMAAKTVKVNAKPKKKAKKA